MHELFVNQFVYCQQGHYKSSFAQFLRRSAIWPSTPQNWLNYAFLMPNEQATKSKGWMPWHRKAYEGRGKLRKATGRCKQSVIRRYPNGET